MFSLSDNKELERYSPPETLLGAGYTVGRSVQAEETETEGQLRSLSQSEQPGWSPPTGEPHWNGRILLLKAGQVLGVLGASSDEGKQEELGLPRPFRVSVTESLQMPVRRAPLAGGL